MRYKMIVSDFDDTLYDGVHINKRVVAAIKAYQNAGGIFSISTGRAFAALKGYLFDYNLTQHDVPIMCCQGAMAVASKTHRIFFEERIDNAVAVEWLRAVGNDIVVHAYVDDELYATKSNDFSDMYSDTMHIHYDVVGDLAEFLHSTQLCPHKMLIVDNKDNITQMQSEFSYKYDRLVFVSSHTSLLEITSKSAGKGNALKRVAGILGIDVSDVVCIGDNQNDISMLAIAGLGVAVGNARGDVKAVADIVVDAHKDEGVAFVIESVLSGAL